MNNKFLNLVKNNCSLQLFEIKIIKYIVSIFDTLIYRPLIIESQ